MYLYSKRRKVASLLIFLMVFQILEAPVALALTGGPTQPEVQSFEPAGTTEMVDLFTGDFTYNIPLFELPGPNGGYPFNLSYHAGIGMDQEASWVGLGWNLNPGAITRQMRGLPDEFKGDGVQTKMSLKPNITVGLGAGGNVELFGADALAASLGFSVYNNNYKGVGYSLGATLGYSAASNSGMTAGLGLSLSLDNQEGVSINPSLSLGIEDYEMKLGAGYNSRQGLRDISLSHSQKVGVTIKSEDGDVDLSYNPASSSSLSLFNPGFTPRIGMAFRNINISAEFKPGGSWWGIFGSPYIRGFYNEQRLRNDDQWVPSPAYGYLNYQYAAEDNAMLDFNREHDGMVRKESPNLPLPSLTYDIYSLSGQGIAAMYRPFRNDFGIIHDPVIESHSKGGSVGVDAAPTMSHVGVNLSINHTKSASGKWEEDNDINDYFEFQQEEMNDIYEPWYFKSHGEPTAVNDEAYKALGAENAVRVELSDENMDPVAQATLTNEDDPISVSEADIFSRDRIPRGEVITPYTNGQILKGQEEILPFFNILYENAVGKLIPYERSGLPEHHTAGFTSLTSSGLRYNYCLPAYNLKQEEALFSVKEPASPSTRVDVATDGGDLFYEPDNTDEFLKMTELPKYAHSYLLTSIVGPDYVDVEGDGVSEDDLGYWVKFTYKKMATSSDPYIWRAPFSKALYQESLKTDPRDDKGSYVYGEKEIWYLSRVETKSHITDFVTGPREDSRGAVDKFQNTAQLGKQLHKLEEIRLYTRSAGSLVPLKTIKFEYDYSLCQGVPNSSSGNGKLTLKKVWFEYGNSLRGRLNPYRFSYHSNNPDYNVDASDRWGIYRPPDYPLQNHEFPYSEQDPAKKAQIDSNAAAWSLKEISLPSGGKIVVDYESDDYGYVQHRTAMQMVDIVDPYTDASSSLPGTFSLKDSDMKVRFKLEKPMDGELVLDEGEQEEEVQKYLDKDREQLYFKLQINLRSSSEDFHEYITGYVDIDLSKGMGLEKDGSGDYAYGYFHVKEEDGHHPFSMRAWQHLKVNQPLLARIGRKLKPADDDDGRVSQIKSLTGIGSTVMQIFKGFYDYCEGKGWGKEVIADRSWIRLKSPDKVKYGGGLRVKQVTVSDEWKFDEEGIYGQVYDYSMVENGDTISSGVAAYEPFNGGDENALKYAKKYTQSVPLSSDNNLYFEYPVNESYYPGPGVGYRRVTVSSLASASLAGKSLSYGNDVFPDGEGISFGTSGVTIHEFYTARDFPVITDETEKQNKPYKLVVPVPFLGTMTITNLTASQGYSIVTNNMHGKPRMVSNYRQDETGKMEPDPVSWIKYNYMHEDRIYDGEKVKTLSNTFREIDKYTVGLASEPGSDPTFSIGQETEFFLDMREHKDITWIGGAKGNLDIVMVPVLVALVPVPIFTAYPNVGKHSKRLRTAVTNKVIFKTGILESIQAYDGGSLITTQNLQWDKLTGRPIITKVNNNFDDPVYTYHTPAYTQYEGMGAAYRNIRLNFSLYKVTQTPFRHNLYHFTVAAGVEQFLRPGDELVLYSGDENTTVIGKAIYTGLEEGQHLLYSESNLTNADYLGLITRSGYRNQLNVDAGMITALENPAGQNDKNTYSRTLTVPVVN